MEENNFTEDNIPLLDFLTEIKEKVWQILFIGFIGMVIASIFTFFIMKPTYSSTVDLVVNEPINQQNQQINQSTIQTNLSLLNTYEGIIKKPNVLEQVIEETNSDLSADELAQVTTVSTEEDSLLLSISVEGESPYEAADLANSIANNFVSEVQRILQVNNVFIWNSAEPILSPISPNILFNILLGFILGAFIGIMYFVIKYVLDPTIRSEKLAEELGLTPLGVIPLMSENVYENTVLREEKPSNTNKIRRV